MKIASHVVQVNEPDEKNALSLKCHDVNIRLFQTNEEYKKLIIQAIDYIKWHLKCIFEDYHNIRGISAVKLGIPWNIVAYMDNVNIVHVCLNPKVTKRSSGSTTVKTKCPAISLTEEHQAERFYTIDMEFNDLNGQKVIYNNITRSEGGFVIQHEIEHSLGLNILTKGGS